MREYKNCTVFLTKQLEKEVLWTICFAGLEMSALAAKKPEMPKKTQLAKGPKCITPVLQSWCWLKFVAQSPDRKSENYFLLPGYILQHILRQI
mmetsp:Transcript_43581/g.71215  ORF Transcript_43581/g.71215 Transcript_43581/m.71215 type:complete len:93 (+) Transcript_43581:1444-1722(+)